MDMCLPKFYPTTYEIILLAPTLLPCGGYNETVSMLSPMLLSFVVQTLPGKIRCPLSPFFTFQKNP